MQGLLIVSLSLCDLIGLKGDTLVTEQHEVVDKSLSSFCQSIFRMDRTVGDDLEYQLFVVGLLLNTIVLDTVLYVLDRCKDRIGKDRS